MFAWLLLRPKLFGTLLILALLGSWYGYTGIRHWLDARSLAKVTAQRDEARQEAAVAKADAKTAGITADAAKAARNQNDVAIPKVRAATSARIERVDSGSPADTEQRLRDDTEAVADYEAAADRLSRAHSR